MMTAIVAGYHCRFLAPTKLDLLGHTSTALVPIRAFTGKKPCNRFCGPAVPAPRVMPITLHVLSGVG